MLAGLLSRLRRVGSQGRGGNGAGVPNARLLEELCEFEKRWLERLSYDDLVYYSMPFHEDEAREALGEEAEEFLKHAPLWRELVFKYNIDSACTLLEKLKKNKTSANTTPR